MSEPVAPVLVRAKGRYTPCIYCGVRSRIGRCLICARNGKPPTKRACYIPVCQTLLGRQASASGKCRVHAHGGPTRRYTCPNCKGRKHPLAARCMNCRDPNKRFCLRCGRRLRKRHVSTICGHCQYLERHQRKDPSYTPKNVVVTFQPERYRKLMAEFGYSAESLAQATQELFPPGVAARTIKDWLLGFVKPYREPLRLVDQVLGLEPCSHCDGTGAQESPVIQQLRRLNQRDQMALDKFRSRERERRSALA